MHYKMISTHIGKVGVCAIALGFATLVMPGAAVAQDVATEIEKVRLATLKYNDVKVAKAAGFIPAPPGDCVDAAHEGLPAHWGGMGIPKISDGTSSRVSLLSCSRAVGVSMGRAGFSFSGCA